MKTLFNYFHALFCYFGCHSFGDDWTCQATRGNGYDAQMWFERQCEFCQKIEKRDFR